MAVNLRMLPPQSSQTVVVRGTISYSGTPGTPVDIPFTDLGGFAGWTPVAPVGTTAQRPKPTSDNSWLAGILAGGFYIDTTLGKAIVWDEATMTWRDPATGAAV